MSNLKQLESLLASNAISRREFIAHISAMGLTAAISPVLLSGQSHAATPRKGGRLKMGLLGGSTTDSLDPGTLTDTVQLNLNWQTRNALVEVDTKGQPVPELAESWEATPDATQWTFKLRQGIEFHNGKTMDAEDVLFSLNHHRSEKSKSGGKTLLKQVKDIKAVDKNSIVVTLNGGNADFPFILSDYHFTITPSGTTDFEDGMGTGGYIISKNKPGVRIVSKRNPNYWKSNRAHFDEIETLIISDSNARSTALATKKVDVINRCDLKTVHLLERNPKIQIIRTTGTMHYTFAMMTDVAPYNNNDLRLALKYAINREEMVKKVLSGYGAVGNDHPIAPSMQFFDKSQPQRSYDPEKAAFHLKKSGFKNEPIKLHVAEAAFNGAVDAGVLFQEQAKKAGITLDIVREPDDGYWKAVWMKKPFCAVYWSGRPTVDWMYTLTYDSTAKWNDAHWENERFDKLLVEARSELDNAKRATMYAEMQRLVSDDGGQIIPMFADHVMGASKKIGFDKVSGVRELDDARNGERWWFA